MIHKIVRAISANEGACAELGASKSKSVVSCRACEICGGKKLVLSAF